MMNLTDIKNCAIELLDRAIDNRYLGVGRIDSLAFAIDEMIEAREQAREDRERWLRIKEATDEFRRDLETRRLCAPVGSVLDIGR